LVVIKTNKKRKFKFVCKSFLKVWCALPCYFTRLRLRKLYYCICVSKKANLSILSKLYLFEKLEIDKNMTKQNFSFKHKQTCRKPIFLQIDKNIKLSFFYKYLLFFKSFLNIKDYSIHIQQKKSKAFIKILLKISISIKFLWPRLGIVKEESQKF